MGDGNYTSHSISIQVVERENDTWASCFRYGRHINETRIEKLEEYAGLEQPEQKTPGNGPGRFVRQP